VVRVWHYRRQFTLKAPRLFATCVLLAVSGVLLTIASWQYADARRFSREAIDAPLMSARLVPAAAQSSTAFELTYRTAPGPAPDRTERVPVALWESAQESGRVRLKRAADGAVQIWRPASGTTIGILTGVGLALLLAAAAIAIPGIRAAARARRGLPAPLSWTTRLLSRASFWTLFGSIWLSVGLPFLLLAAVFAWQDWRLSTSGRTAEGMVLTKDIRQNGKRGSRPTYRHSIQYRFEADGRVRQGQSDVSESAWAALVERQPVRIEYVPGSRLHRMAGTNERTELAIFGGVGLLVSAAGALIVRADWRSRRRAKRLLESGIRAHAKIVGVEPARIRVNREPLWRIRYEYLDREHRRRQGSTYVTVEEADRWKEGDTAAILVDPAAPRSTVWVGRASEVSA
jgi:hypothetical protein